MPQAPRDRAKSVRSRLSVLLALLLLVLRIGTNDHDFTMATNDFALLAHRLD